LYKEFSCGLLALRNLEGWSPNKKGYEEDMDIWNAIRKRILSGVIAPMSLVQKRESVASASLIT